MSVLSVSVDHELNAAYIRTSNKPVARTNTLTSDVNIDIDTYGELVGIECLVTDAVIPFTTLIEEFNFQLSDVKKVRELLSKPNQAS